ncbi:MAG TPA: beta-galactosidase, partial [Kofleriaceae bacterium]|nr:beta-galactosidase [Kofleriaceae bacterium]
MEERRRTGFDARGLTVGGRPDRRLALRAGAVHYWRAPASSWPTLLAAVRALGCTAVDTPVPWSVHERSAGAFDWSGDRDLPAFLAAAAAAGLAAIVRPGPWVDAQLTSGGLPERIVRDPDIAARAAHGGPAWLPHPPRAYPLPSLASARYHAEVAAWFAEVGRVIAPRLAPDGPVVALAVDHHGGVVYRGGAFDLDYHPDAVAWWRQDHDVEPPTRWADDDAERCAAWVRWKERYLARGLGVLTDALTAAGLGELARFHAAPPHAPWHVDLPAIERAIGGPAAIDVSGGRADLAAIRTRALWTAGSSTGAAPVSVGCGHPAYLPPRTDDDERAAALTALA